MVFLKILRDKWRKCTFDYYIRNLDKLKGAYHSITKPAEVLFYVVPINRVLNPTSTEVRHSVKLVLLNRHLRWLQ